MFKNAGKTLEGLGSGFLTNLGLGKGGGAFGRGGILGTGLKVGGSIGKMFSDERLKHNISKVSSSSQVDSMLGGMNAYSYSYLGENNQRLGVMAQEMEKSSLGKRFVVDTPYGKMIDPGVVGPLLAHGAMGSGGSPPSYKSNTLTTSASSLDVVVAEAIYSLIERLDDREEPSVNVYTDIQGQNRAAIDAYKSEVFERSARSA